MSSQRRPWYSLKVKFALLIFFLLGSTFLVLSLFLVNQSLDSTKRSMEESAKAFAELSVRTLGSYYTLYYQSGYTRYISLTDDVYALQPIIERVRIVSVEGGEVLADSQIDSAELMSPPLEAHKPITDSTVISLIEDGKVAYLADKGPYATRILVPYVSDFGSRPFSILYDVSYASAEQAASQARWIILTITLSLGVAAIVLINWVVGRTILTPVNRLIKYAQDVASGNLHARFSLKTGDELENLAWAVDNMSKNLSQNIIELKQLDESKSEFIIIASHNLRTPLTNLKGAIPVLTSTDQEDPELKAIAAKSANVALTELGQLVEQLIAIVKLRQEFDITLSPIPLRQVVSAALNSLQSQIETRKLTIELSLDPEQTVLAEAELLTQVVTNILDNAIKFSTEEGVIEVKTINESSRSALQIIDHGIGMSPEKVDNLFQMFHRQTSLLDYNYKGVGLGLYISRLILTKFKAWLHIESQPNQGTTVTIYFAQK